MKENIKKMYENITPKGTDAAFADKVTEKSAGASKPVRFYLPVLGGCMAAVLIMSIGMFMIFGGDEPEDPVASESPTEVTGTTPGAAFPTEPATTSGREDPAPTTVGDAHSGVPTDTAPVVLMTGGTVTTAGTGYSRPHTAPQVIITTPPITTGRINAPHSTSAPTTAPSTTRLITGTTLPPDWTTTPPPALAGKLSPEAQRIENMSDMEFVDAFVNNQFSVPTLYAVAADDFAANRLDLRETGINGVSLENRKSASSRAEAMKIMEEIADELRNSQWATHTIHSIEYLGESEYYYVYLMKYSYITWSGNQQRIQEISSKIVIFKESAISANGTSHNQNSYSINALNKQSVTDLIDTLVIERHSRNLPPFIYRSVEETATQFIYTYYMVNDQPTSRVIWLYRGQHIVEKSTGEIITFRGNGQELFTEIKQAFNPYSHEIWLLKCTGSCGQEYMCYQSGATLCYPCKVGGTLVQVLL